MKVTVECAKCSTETKIDVSDAIHAIMDATERGSIWAGFLCTECGESEDDEV